MPDPDIQPPRQFRVSIKALITDEMKAAVEKAKADIIAGTVQVHDFMSDNACPY